MEWNGLRWCCNKKNEIEKSTVTSDCVTLLIHSIILPEAFLQDISILT